MSIKEDLEKQVIQAMKSKDAFRLSVLRFLLAQVKNKEIDQRKPITDEELFRVIQTLVKQRRDGIEFSEKAGRADLVEKEKKELEILESYLPSMLNDDEINAIIAATVQELNAAGMKDMGRVMKAVMSKTAGRADGGKINDLVKKSLSS